MQRVLAYKLAHPDGFDFYTGRTINYREGIGRVVKPPHANASLGICSSGVLHASSNPNDCFVGAKIPCSAYRVSGIPACGDKNKWGFLELKVIREITELDKLFGWKYSEAVNPIPPFKLPKINQVTPDHLELLRRWDSVRASVWYSVWAYIGSLSPNILKWKYVNYTKGIYPFQPVVDLWKQGIVPSYDGKLWRLHSGEKADTIWEGELLR